MCEWLWYNSTMKTTVSTTLDSTTINKLTQTLKPYAISFNHPYITHAFDVDGTRVSVYTSKKVVFQGEQAHVLANQFTTTQSFIPHAGSDEVGTGDYFGPVVVCACICDEHIKMKLDEHRIMDSKLMVDETMIKLYHQLKDDVTHSLLIVSPTKYNEVHQTHNMNAIKAKLHYEAYMSLKKKTTLPQLCVIDQFTPKTSFYSYLSKQPQEDLPLHFETKAESKYLAVALASVFARAVFVLSLRQLEQHYACSLPKGAAAHVDEAAKHFIQVHGEANLKHVAKVHFKNTQRILK